MTHLYEAVLLVGGRGTRLQSVVCGRPKPMAEVGGRPFAEWLLLFLRSQGIQRVVFCTGYLSEVVETHFGDGRRWKMEVAYSRDPFPLGTAGAVRHAVGQVHSERFLMLNGDSYCRVDVKQFEQLHAARNACATLWLVSTDDCSRYGSVDIGADGAVRAFHEKSPEKRAGLINAGVYLLERELVQTIPEGRIVSIEREVFPNLIGRGLYALAENGPFLDIGTPESYAAAEQFFAANVQV